MQLRMPGDRCTRAFAIGSLLKNSWVATSVAGIVVALSNHDRGLPSFSDALTREPDPVECPPQRAMRTAQSPLLLFLREAETAPNPSLPQAHGRRNAGGSLTSSLALPDDWLACKILTRLSTAMKGREFSRRGQSLFTRLKTKYHLQNEVENPVDFPSARKSRDADCLAKAKVKTRIFRSYFGLYASLRSCRRSSSG